MEPKKYGTATAFRRALEDRLKDMSRQESVDFQRLRRQVAFDRLLARFFSSADTPWILKSGYAMELRIKAARATKDIDLTMHHEFFVPSNRPKERNQAVLQLLQKHAQADLSDYFAYNIGQAMMDLTAPIYGGARFPVEVRMDGRIFAKFHVDVALGDPLLEPLEAIQGRDWLSFAGIPKPTLQMISREQQFAEKLHAYTLPRKGVTNTRVRDLIDMILLIHSRDLSTPKVAHALRLTFDRRKTHPIPDAILPPPADWERPYAAMAKECGLSDNVEHAFTVLRSFLNRLP
jgi:hypothetical protein